MTAEYSTVEVRRELAALAARPTPNSVFTVVGSSVEVRSTGDGFIFPDHGEGHRECPRDHSPRSIAS